jgi:hypothetical protein
MSVPQTTLTATDGFGWTELWRKEDWWAVWLGLGVVLGRLGMGGSRQQGQNGLLEPAAGQDHGGTFVSGSGGEMAGDLVGR